LNDLLAQDTSLQENFEIITSVTGVGQWTAWQILMTTQNFTKFTDPKQYASYCGVAPFSKSSGRWKGRNKLSGFANKTMKSLLQMCALSAIKYDEDLKAFYERKVQEGKSKMSVLNAIRNKIIHRIFACIKKGEEYKKNVKKNLDCS
jgi:transposase